MLDMDGTILDLAYDNFMWMQHVPSLWAEQNDMSLADAQRYLLQKFGAAQGDLRWYCLDHWSEHLGLDVHQLHRDNHHMIDFLPGARAFLERIREADVQLLLVTNSHQYTLDLKHEVTGLVEVLRWRAHLARVRLREGAPGILARVAGRRRFQSRDHDVRGRQSSGISERGNLGVAHPVAISRPDTSGPPTEQDDFVSVDGISELI